MGCQKALRPEDGDSTCPLFTAVSCSLRSTHATSLKCNYVANGEVWMRMWQFMDDLVLMDDNQARPPTLPLPQLQGPGTD